MKQRSLNNRGEQSTASVKRLAVQASAVLLCIGVALTYSGCGASKPGATPAIAPIKLGKQKLPPEITEQAVLYELTTLATLPRKNPFDSPIMQKELAKKAEEGGAKAEPEIPRINPFEQIQLAAILNGGKGGKQRLAVLGMDGKTLIVHQGEILTNSAIESAPSVEIAKIEKNAVHLYSPNEYVELSVKTLELPSLIGYKRTGSASAQPANANKGEAAEGETQPVGFFESDQYKNLPPDVQSLLKDQYKEEQEGKSDKKSAGGKGGEK